MLLRVFDEPLPADVPFEYVVEEFKLWERLREQIRVLEHELAEIINGKSLPVARMRPFRKAIAHYIDLTDTVLKNRTARPGK